MNYVRNCYFPAQFLLCCYGCTFWSVGLKFYPKVVHCIPQQYMFLKVSAGFITTCNFIKAILTLEQAVDKKRHAAKCPYFHANEVLKPLAIADRHNVTLEIDLCSMQNSIIHFSDVICHPNSGIL